MEIWAEGEATAGQHRHLVKVGGIMVHRPIGRLYATPQRVNSRQAHSHLVDNVNAARTLCGRWIDSQTWRYHGVDENLPMCAACRNIEDKRRNQESAAKQ